MGWSPNALCGCAAKISSTKDCKIIFKRVVPKGVTTRSVQSPSVCMCMSVCGYVEFGGG